MPKYKKASELVDKLESVFSLCEPLCLLCETMNCTEEHRGFRQPRYSTNQDFVSVYCSYKVPTEVLDKDSSYPHIHGVQSVFWYIYRFRLHFW